MMKMVHTPPSLTSETWWNSSTNRVAVSPRSRRRLPSSRSSTYQPSSMRVRKLPGWLCLSRAWSARRMWCSRADTGHHGYFGTFFDDPSSMLTVWMGLKIHHRFM
ncbi:hypothetical protein D3C87_1669450 [compost metagenome]